MHAVGVVGRDQQRFLNDPHEGIAFRQHALQDLLEERAVGAAGRAGADFLVVGAHQHAAFVAVGFDQRLQAGEARQQVVQARAGDEVLVEADHRGALGVVEAQLVVQYRVGADTVFFGQALGQYGAEVGTVLAGELARIGGSFVRVR